MAGLAERDGWDLLGIADTPGNAMDAWVALTLAATRTERIGLAACVTNLVSRHPAVTVAAAASVDAVSGGRFILGVGTDHSGVANVDARASSPRSFREGLAAARALLAGQEAGPDGGGARGLPGGRRVPLYAAASGPAALRTAGAVAAGAFVNYGPQADRLAVAGTPADCLAQVRAALAAGAQRLMFTVSLAADPLRTVELFGRHVLPSVRATSR